MRTLAALVAVGCGSAPPPPPPAPTESALARFECDRCHDGGATFTAAPWDRSCVGCHRRILAGDLDDRYLADDVARWKGHLHRLVDTPSLANLDQRWTRSAFVTFVQEPVDRRPHLPAQMPRLALTEADAQALADELGLRDPPADAPTGDPARGALLVAARCAPCHDAAPLAPDLARVRDVSWPVAVDRWLRDPGAVVPGAAMPRLELDPSDRRDLVAALFSGDLSPAPSAAPPPPAPVPTRPVTWAEVDAAVFHEVCRHCHSDPAGAGGDGGPGNTGGFGFAGAGLDLSTREGVLRGGRHDLLERGPDGTPRLVAHLEARRAEVSGAPVAGVLGMPLGLPPLPPDRVALVRAWIDQGAPP